MSTGTNGRQGSVAGAAHRLRLTETGVVVDETAAPDSAQLNDAPATVEPAAATEATAPLLEEGDGPAEAATEAGAERRSRVRRVLRAAAGVAVLLVLVAGVGYFWLFHNANSDAAYQVKPSAPSNSGGADPTARGLTAEEIAQELNKHAPAVGAVSANAPGSATPAASLPSHSPITDRLPNQDFSATVTPVAAPSTVAASGGPAKDVPVTAGTSLASTGSAATPATAHSTAPPSPTPAPASSYAAHSIRARVEKVNGNPGATGNARAVATPAPAAAPTPAPTPPVTVDSAAAQTTPTTPLPPLGTLLPVRTLAQLYTVRAAFYVRLQLKRDVAGPGWSLRRGTEFYGQLRGAETATGRAFVTVLGYIEPETNLWRELPGQLLGADGTEGLPGHTHKLNAGWRKALKKAGAVALETVTAIASGLGRRPVVIADGGAGRVLEPLAQEAQGLANGRDGDSFIEVPAATAGYILVITDPAERGVTGKGE